MAMLVDIVFVLDKFVPHDLLQVITLVAQVLQKIDRILHQMEAIQPVLNAHVEGCRDGAFLVVAAHMKIAIGAPVGEAMDQRGISVEGEKDLAVAREQRIIVDILEPVRMFAG